MHKTKPAITKNRCDILSASKIINPAFIEHEKFIAEQIKQHPEIMQVKNCQAFKEFGGVLS